MASARSAWKDLLERIAPGSLQDLLWRTCAGWCRAFKILTQGLLLGRIWTGSPQDLPKRTCTSHARTLRGFYSQGPVQDHARQYFARISTRYSHRDLYKIMQWPLRFQQVLHKIFSEGPVHGRIFRKIFAHGAVQIMQGPLGEEPARISTRISQDLYKIMQGPLREDFVRISTKASHKGLYKIPFY